MHRSTSAARRACAVGTTIALIGLTTGLGVFSATAASAAVVEPTSAVATTATDAPTDAATDGAAGATTDPSTEAPSAAPTDPATDAPSDDATAPAPADEPAAPATTAPATPTAPAKEPAAPHQRATPAVAPAATSAAIVGDAKVGSVLRVDVTGITAPYDYAWTLDDDAATVVSTNPSFPLTDAEVGHTVTVTVSGAVPEESVSDTTDVVTEDVTFAGEPTTVDEPLVIEVTAGQSFSQSFEAATGSGDISYAVGYSFPDDDESDPVDPDDTPESYLPDLTKLNTKTGLLSGTPTSAGFYDFTVVASNETSEAIEYVEVVVNPDVPVGVVAYASDTSSTDIFENGKDSNYWIIDWNGEVIGVHQPADPEAEPTLSLNSQPTVQQGGSLWVDGTPVDQYGNSTLDWDGEGDFPLATVTSDVATDQIAVDPDEFATKVTFPHASTHNLTVAEDGQSVTFAVTVVPTAATTVVTTTAVTPKGQLAYTGSDATDALPWALALIAAGAGLVGFRSLRRRAQR